MVPGRAPPRPTSVQTDIRRIERDSLTCANMHTEPAHKEQRSSSYSKHSAAFTTLRLRRDFLSAVCYRQMETSHISPPNSFLTIPFLPFCSVLSTLINTSVSQVFKHLSNNDGHEEKTSRNPHLRCTGVSEGGSLQERPGLTSQRPDSAAILVAACASLDPDVF